jgi:uncharacterized SAM-binding protein YcdF (DUF218 family)
MELGFIVKKLVGILIQPMSVVLFLLFMGLLFLYKGKMQISKKILTLGFAILLFFSYDPVANTLMQNLENQYPKLEIVPEDADYILLLGGDFEMRAWEVLRFYHKNKDLKIITSGYKGSFSIPEALRSANILIELGISKENIIMHTKPKDTKEEAIKIKKLLGEKPFILVTAGYHMPRAMALFKKEGTCPIAAPALTKKRDIDFFSIPSVRCLYETQIALHEYIGLLWAKLRGQI